MFYADGGEDLVNGGRAAGRRRGGRTIAPTATTSPSDEYDPAWDWAGALSDLRIFYRVGRALAETDDWPNWHPRRRIPRHPRPLARRAVARQ